MNAYIRFKCFAFVCYFLLLLSPLTAEEFELPLDRSALDRSDPAYRTSYAPVLKPARKAVVAVHSASVVRYIRRQGIDPREELMRRYFGLPSPSRPEPEEFERRYSEGVGSGVVISADGYILTNNHVIMARDGNPADEILVELNDGRELPAQLVGRDPLSDLAVLKVEAADLPFLPIADSELLEVGDVVFAIGNPMGIGLTITQGIVSATGRSISILGELGYENFIQTDAPINPGNSGGALVDAYGRLVGINTAILSRTGGSMGLGFAIPSSFARTIAIALVREGEVRRGVIGAEIDDLTAEYAEAFKIPEKAGVLVQSVTEGLPAALAGLQRGDVIVTIDGVAVNNVTELRLRLAASPPGKTVRVGFRREGNGEVLEVAIILADPRDPYGTGALSGELLQGIEAAMVDDGQRRHFGLNSQIEGLVVTRVAGDSPFAEILPLGAVLLEINGVRPESVEQARALLESRPVSRVYLFYKGQVRYLAIRS